MLINEKVTQAVNILKEFNIDCWITFVRESKINGDPSLAFLSPADVTWHSAFIISKTGKTCAIVGKYDKATIEEIGAYDQVIAFVEGIKKPFLEYLKSLNPSKIAINYSQGSEICDGLTHGMYLTLTDFFSELGYSDRICSAEKVVSALRERKMPIEIENMKEAIRHTEEIFNLVKDFIKPEKTEAEVGAFMKEQVTKRKLELAWDPHACPSVFSGPDTAEAHYAPTEKIIQPGHVLNMDFGVKVNGYCSDMQRTFYILKDNETKAPPEVQKGFDIIVESIQKSKDAMKPGVLGKEIDKIARDIIVNNGYEEFPHGLGHQVGQYAHDGTALLGPEWEKYDQKPFQKLEIGMVFTIEPRLTVKERGIATVEEMVVVTDSGADWLSHPQKEIFLVK